MAKAKDAPVDDVEVLRARVAELTAALDAQRSDAEKNARSAAEAESFMQRERAEVPSGTFRTVERCARDPKGRLMYKHVGYSEGRSVREPVMEEVEVPEYWYKIDMPPVGGTDLKINGVPMEQGALVKLTLDELSSVKEMIYRLWQHEHNISGSNENFYRKPVQRQLSARG